MNPAPLLVTAVLAMVFSSCCSKAQPRFLQVRDDATRKTLYTAETDQVPAHKLGGDSLKFVDSSGRYVEPAKPRVVKQLTEQEWLAATSGARYALYYCGKCKGCWARVKQR